jgi:hypothetical protein
MLIYLIAAMAAQPAEAQIPAPHSAQHPGSPAAKRGFDSWGTGGGDLFYHRLTGDCAQLQHRIGRNATRGRYVMPLLGVRWALEEAPGRLPRVRFDCLDGGCVAFARPGAIGRAGVHSVPFADSARARSFISRLDALKSACPR